MIPTSMWGGPVDALVADAACNTPPDRQPFPARTLSFAALSVCGILPAPLALAQTPAGESASSDTFALTALLSTLLLVTLGVAISLFLRQRKKAITLRETTAALENSRATLRSLVENAVEGIIMIDERGIVEGFNPASEKIFGYRADEVIGQNVKLLMPEPYHAGHDGYVRAYRETGNKKIIGIGREVEGKRKDGSIFPLDLSVAEVRVGNMRKFSGTIRDITARKHAEQQLRESKITIETVDAFGDGYWDWNIRDDYEYMSPRFWATFGYAPEEKRHHPSEWKAVMYAEDLPRVLENLDRHIETGGVYPYEHEARYRHKSGDTVHVLCRGQVVEWDYKNRPVRMVGTHINITERKRAEAERQQLIERLVDSNQELERFAFVCSHDLQEPLRMIRSFSERLNDHLQPALENDEKGQRYFNFVQDGARRAQLLISDILAYSRIDQDTQKPEPVNFNELVELLLESMQVDLKDVGGEITHDPLPTLIGNRTQLYQLLQNLINNALKYHKPDERPKIHIGCEDLGTHWRFSVRDNGIGMDSKNVHKIFDVFQRLHRKEEYSGTGVGLSICRKVVERHGGEIWVASQKDIGSTFFFTIQKPDRKS